MTRKVDIDRDVALETGIGKAKVRLVTQVFLHRVMKALIEGQTVTLDGFGRMRLAVQGGAPPPHARFGTGDKNTEETDVRWRVHFKKSETMKRALRKHANEQGTRGRAAKRLSSRSAEGGTVLDLRKRKTTTR